MYLQYPGGGTGGTTTVNVRENQLLVGTYDGVNKDFYLPSGDKALHNPPREQVKVYHSGRRLLPTEYEVLETVPGSGYDLVRIKMFTPNVTSKLFADYVIA